MISPQLIKAYEGVPTHGNSRVHYLNISQIIAIRDSTNEHRDVYDILTSAEGQQFHIDKDSPAGKLIATWIESAY